MSLSASSTNPRAARQFMKKYGKSRLRHLLTGFVQQRPSQELASDFGISVERLLHWQELLQTSIELYHISPNINWVLREERSPSRRRLAYMAQQRTTSAVSPNKLIS